MQELYDPKPIEPKWQQRWREAKLFRTEEDPSKPKCYVLEFFPYPSGDGLSVGHCRNYIPADTLARYMRMRGYCVLHPMAGTPSDCPPRTKPSTKAPTPNTPCPAMSPTTNAR